MTQPVYRRRSRRRIIHTRRRRTRPQFDEDGNLIRTRPVGHRHEWDYVEEPTLERVRPCLFCEYTRMQGEHWCKTFPQCRRKEITVYEPHLVCLTCDKRKIKKSGKIKYFTEKNIEKFEVRKFIRKHGP